MARAISKIEKYRDFLMERIDPDTILDCLLRTTILSRIEVDEVKSRQSICQKNACLLDYIIAKDSEKEFINALRDADQQHLANYLHNDGVRHILSESWPLEETQVKIIDANCGSLKDLIDIGGGFIDELLAKKVISHRQKEFIDSKATSSEKNEAFLDILRRGSKKDYKNTIQCLRDSNQEHLAKILDEGGVVLPVHVELREPLAEERLVEALKYLLRGRTVEEFNTIVETTRHKVIAATLGHSIIFYYYCKSSESWRELKKAIRSGSMKVAIEELCKRLDPQINIIIKAINIRSTDCEKIDIYFASKGNRCSQILLLLSIILACMGVISGVGDVYNTQTIPCYITQLECQEAQDKIHLLHSSCVRFTRNFEQLQIATSELLMTFQDNPSNDELISLVLKMYEIPNEETRQKITERIRKVEKEITHRGVKSEQILENIMERAIDLTGKVSFKITTDVFQLADDLLNLVKDEQEIYEKTLVEKLNARENSLQDMVMVLSELIKETEGVNNMLRKVLEKFKEDSSEVCSDIPNIEESQRYGYGDLGTGVLRLTCLLDDTVKMAMLVNELIAQATSLKQDVDHLVEKINGYAKQSIPYLLATLLTVTEQETPKEWIKPR